MAIPLAQTTVSVQRVTRTGPYAAPTTALFASRVRAVIGQGSGQETTDGSQVIVDFSLTCDPVELRHWDRVIDEATQEEYEVTWHLQRSGPHGGHTEAGLRQVTGGSPS